MAVSWPSIEAHVQMAKENSALLRDHAADMDVNENSDEVLYLSRGTF